MLVSNNVCIFCAMEIRSNCNWAKTSLLESCLLCIWYGRSEYDFFSSFSFYIIIFKKMIRQLMACLLKIRNSFNGILISLLTSCFFFVFVVLVNFSSFFSIFANIPHNNKNKTNWTGRNISILSPWRSLLIKITVQNSWALFHLLCIVYSLSYPSIRIKQIDRHWCWDTK